MLRSLKKINAIRAFRHFFSFSPWMILTINGFSVLQTLLSSFSLFMLIPLAQLAGVDLAAYTAGNESVTALLILFFEKQAWSQSLASVLLVYVVAVSLLAILQYIKKVLAAKLQQSYVRETRRQVYQSILQSNWRFLASRRSSDYLHRVGSQVQTMNSSANLIIGFMFSSISLIVFVSIMLSLHWQFSLASLAVGLSLALILVPLRWYVGDAGKRQLRGYQEMFALLSEHLSNLKMIKAAARENQFRDNVNDLSIELENQQLRMTRASAIIALANSIGLAVGFAVLLYIGVAYFDVALTEFVLLLMIMSRLLPQLASLQQNIQSIRFTLPAFLDLELLLEQTKKVREFDIEANVPLLEFEQHIKLNNVSFCYSEAVDQQDSSSKNKDSQWLFKNLNLNIKHNETIALKGASGIGKTTIADMFSSLSIPFSGELLVDDNVIGSQQLQSWRRSLAYVTQEVYIFNDSVRENLRWSSPEASEADMWQALELAAVDTTIKALPQQLDTVIGDRGIRLSGGERQRLALARALLSKAKFLILDEATSALDDDTEQRIHEVLKNLQGKLTVLIIAHRQSTIDLADRVVDVAELRY